MEGLGIALNVRCQQAAQGWMDGVLFAALIISMSANNVYFYSMDGEILLIEEVIAEVNAGRNVRLERSCEKKVTTPRQEAKRLLRQVGIPQPWPECRYN